MGHIKRVFSPERARIHLQLTIRATADGILTGESGELADSLGMDGVPGPRTLQSRLGRERGDGRSLMPPQRRRVSPNDCLQHGAACVRFSLRATLRW